MMPLNASENTAIVARGSLSVPIPFPKEEAKDIEIKISNARPASGPTFRDSIVPCQLEEQVFGYLSTCDLETIRGTNKVLKRCSEAYTHRQRLLDIYHDKQGSFREFFVKPNSPPVRWIADYRGENAEALRNKFMRELYAQADPKTMLKWLQKAPPRLFFYGSNVRGVEHILMASIQKGAGVIGRKFRNANLQDLTHVCRALSALDVLNDAQQRYLAGDEIENSILSAYVNSNSPTQKREAKGFVCTLIRQSGNFDHMLIFCSTM